MAIHVKTCKKAMPFESLKADQPLPLGIHVKSHAVEDTAKKK